MTHFLGGLLLAELSMNGILDRISKFKYCTYLQVGLMTFTWMISFKYSFMNLVDPLDNYVRSILYFQGKQGVGDTGWEESWYVFLFSLSMLFVIETSNFLKQILSWSPFVFLGRVSFSLYIIHVYWMLKFGTWFDKLAKSIFPLNLAILISVCTTSLTLILASYLLIPILDKPGRTFGVWLEKCLSGSEPKSKRIYHEIDQSTNHFHINNNNVYYDAST